MLYSFSSIYAARVLWFKVGSKKEKKNPTYFFSSQNPGKPIFLLASLFTTLISDFDINKVLYLFVLDGNIN